VAKYKILVCDDDDGILDMLAMVLDNKGFDVITEIHSINIYDKLNEVKPDLLLLDLWMPKLSGEEILQTLKQSDATKKLPVIVMSASRDGGEIAKRFSADDYLEKPFDIKKLMSKIQTYVHS
jgi:DNA-binding response OmpR family regulator